MPRKRSDYICPKCGKKGFLSNTQWTRSARYSISDKTTLADGMWITEKEKEYSTGTIQHIKRYKSYSKKYTPICVVHYDSVTGKRSKCYITNILKKENESKEDAHKFMLDSVKEFFKELGEVLIELRKYPLTKAEINRLNEVIRDFFRLFSGDHSAWADNIINIYEKNGMNPFEEKSIEDGLKGDPYKALELSEKVTDSFPLLQVIHELFAKYILPRRLAIQNELHSTLSEQHFH